MLFEVVPGVRHVEIRVEYARGDNDILGILDVRGSAPIKRVRHFAGAYWLVEDTRNGLPGSILYIQVSRARKFHPREYDYTDALLSGAKKVPQPTNPVAATLSLVVDYQVVLPSQQMIVTNIICDGVQPRIARYSAAEWYCPLVDTGRHHLDIGYCGSSYSKRDAARADWYAGPVRLPIWS